jgi:myo-inositol-1(or 4)-monophosphatase
MRDQELLSLCAEVADSVARSLKGVADWSAPGGRPGQYAIDLVADSVALEILERAGLGVLSEESGRHRPEAPLTAVIDPVDGTTNASRGIPWYACSICVIDSEGPRVSYVANLVSDVRYSAIRGEGAWRDGERIAPSGCRRLGDAVVAISGYPRSRLGWSQFRAFGAAALDMCAVAEGTFDAYAVVGNSRLGSWDYLGAMLICTESGAIVKEVDGLELVTTEHSARRSVAAAGTSELLSEVVDGVLAARHSPDESLRGDGG